MARGLGNKLNQWRAEKRYLAGRNLLARIKHEESAAIENIVNAHNALDSITQRRGIDNQGYTFDLGKYQTAGYRMHGNGMRADCEMSETSPVYNNAQVVAQRMETGKA